MNAHSVYGIPSVGGTSSYVRGMNPLLATRVDTTSPLSGTRVIEDIVQLSEAINRKDWLSGGLTTVATVADVASAVTDPLGTLIAMGAGWLMDHLDPLKSWLNELTGDPASVAMASQTWNNISQSLLQSAQQAHQAIDSYFQEQQSIAINAFKQLQSDYANHLGAASQLAGALSTGLSIASAIVQMVHDLVRDAIADIVGKIGSSVIIELISLGLATPWVVSNVVSMVTKWTALISSKVTALIRSCDKLSGLVKRSDELLATLRTLFSKASDAVGNFKSAAHTKISNASTSIRRGIDNGIDGTKKSVDILKKWWKPQYTDDVIKQAKSSADEVRDILSSSEFVDFCRRKGIDPLDMDSFQALKASHVDTLSPEQVDAMRYVRDKIGTIKEGDIVSKVYARELEVPRILKDSEGVPVLVEGKIVKNPDPAGFVARSQDTAGRGLEEKFNDLRLDYYKKDGTRMIPPQGGMSEVRFRADAHTAGSNVPAYATDTPGVLPSDRTVLQNKVLAGNYQHPDGPYAGHGFTASTNGSVVAEYQLTPRGKGTAPIDYLEHWDAGTGRRTHIRVQLPWDPNKTIWLPTLR